MNFGQHIYIIKSSKDEQDQKIKDWNESFRRFLELLLTRLSGDKVSVNEVYCEELDIESIYSPFTVLIPLISPSLLDSPVFKEEIKIFHENAINKGKNNISWNSRIFKVVRKPQGGHFLLDFLSNSTSYDFFHYDTANDELVIYDDFIGPSSEKTFWMRLYDLAYDIFSVLDSIKSAEDEIASISHDINAITIFLAEVGSDLKPHRDALKRELMRNGYKVLPDKNMPQNLDLIMKQVKKDLAESNMSIHLVGPEYPKIRGTNMSLLDLQNRLASEHFEEVEKLGITDRLNLGRVMWILPGLKNISVKQRLFIENLRKDTLSMRKADLLETPLEELKAFVIKKIQEGVSEYNRFYKKEEAEKRKIIYLIYDKSEAQKCKKIHDYLIKSGYDVITSDFEGTPDEIRIKHNDSLKRCDATLIYYGNDNEEWIRSKQKDLMKSLGLGREKPIFPQAILVENSSQLEDILNPDKEALILQNTKRFSVKVIEPFLEKLKD